MTRDERESLEDEIAMAKARADEMRCIAIVMKKFAPNHGSARGLYEETANLLSDMADDFEYAEPFAAMRRALEEADQEDADVEAGQMRRAYEGSVL